MKKIGLFALLVILLSGCKDKQYSKYMCYEPVYTDAETFRKPVTFESTRSITKKGNIYFKDNYLFVVAPNEGIHVIDNSNPSNPVNTGFLNIMGCSGLAIKGNQLYVTALIDLVVIDITTLGSPVELSRLEDVFPTALPLMEKNYPTKDIDKNLGVVTSWNAVETKEEGNPFPVWNNCMNCEFFAMADASSGGSGNSGSTGTAGSITKMSIIGDNLYVLDNWKLIPYDITTPSALVQGQETYVSWEAETLFPHDHYLFMGTTTGMIIYDVIDPNAPVYVSSISHARACDPVVVQGNYAYVTVRSGGPCGGDINQMDVIDISNISNPVLAESFQLKNPHGLGIDGDVLFVCDGKEGLKVFDSSNPLTCGDELIKEFKNIQATDVIPLNGVAMVIGDDGIYQYDYSDPENLKLLSKIKF